MPAITYHQYDLGKDSPSLSYFADKMRCWSALSSSVTVTRLGYDTGVIIMSQMMTTNRELHRQIPAT